MIKWVDGATGGRGRRVGAVDIVLFFSLLLPDMLLCVGVCM